MKARIETPIPVSPETFWSQLFFDHEYNRGLYEVLGFLSAEVLTEERLPSGNIRRVTRLEPPIAGAPGVLKQKLAARFSYLDDGEFDPTRQVWTFRNESSVAKDSTHIGGTIHVEPHSQGALLVVQVEIKVSAFGLGGLAERVIEKNARESYKTTARYLHGFAAQRGLLHTQPSQV